MAAACLLFAALTAGATQPRDSLDIGDDRLEVRGLAFSPDGRLIAIYNSQAYKDKDKSLTLWDVAAKKRVAVLKSDGWQSSRIFRFTADGKSLVVYGASSTKAWDGSASVVVWDLETYKERRRVDNFEKISDASGPCVFTPDGKWMICVSASRGILVFDLATGKVAKTIQDDGSPIGKVSAMTVSPDGKTLAVGTGHELAAGRFVRWGGAIYLCDLEKGEIRHKIARAGADDRTPGHIDGIGRLAFSPDGKRLVSITDSFSPSALWDPATGLGVDVLRPGFELGGVEALAYSPDGKTLALASSSLVELWDIAEGGFRDDFRARPEPRGTITHLAFSPDGKTLVSAGSQIPVQFWDVPAGPPKSVRKDTTPPVMLPPYIPPTPPPP